MNDFTLTAIIVAAGAGSRLKARTPKAFLQLGKLPMYQYSLETFVSHESVRDIVIVVPYGMVTATQQSLMSIKTSKSIFAVAGGKERWQSVQNGVLATDADWILVHDAARPFVTHAVIDGVIDKCIANDCVITATPEVDTIRALSGDFAGKIIDRSTLIRTGTPQLFRRAVLVEAFMPVRQASRFRQPMKHHSCSKAACPWQSPGAIRPISRSPRLQTLP